MKVACGAGHTLCLDDQGRIHVFGTNRYGQLGTLDKQVKKLPFCVRDAKFFGNQVPPRFEDIGCGENHSVAVAAGGVVYAWGANKHGQLGVGDTADKVHPTPLVNFHKKIVGLACGSIHSVYLSSTSCCCVVLCVALCEKHFSRFDVCGVVCCVTDR